MARTPDPLYPGRRVAVRLAWRKTRHEVVVLGLITNTTVSVRFSDGYSTVIHTAAIVHIHPESEDIHALEHRSAVL